MERFKLAKFVEFFVDPNIVDFSNFRKFLSSCNSVEEILVKCVLVFTYYSQADRVSFSASVF